MSEVNKLIEPSEDEGRIEAETYLLNLATLEFLKASDVSEGSGEAFKDYALLSDNILHHLRRLIYKAKAESSSKLTVPRRLDVPQIVVVLRYLYRFANVRVDGGFEPSAPTVLMRYDANAGIYTDDMHIIDRVIAELSHGDVTRERRNNIYLNIEALSDVVSPSEDKNLIPVGNGIYDLSSGELLPFDPDRVFITKTPVNYNPDAELVFIDNPDGTRWDIENWMSELTDNSEITQLLWQIIGASIRPNHYWSKSIWLYSEVGMNGKGTFCELIRQIVGPHNVATLSILDFGKPFALENLFSKSVVLCDENDVGKYIDDAANYKAACTADVLNCDRKHKKALTIRFNGLIIECMNGFPRTRDKTGSFYRRLILVPFNKSFIGSERKYIKTDYIKRTDVLEYVLKKVLQMKVEELSVPQACTELLEDYRGFNNTVLEFWNSFKDRFAWSILPTQFLYDLYQSYCKRNAPSSRIMNLQDFRFDIKRIADESDDFEYGRFTVGTQMDAAEMLIIEYNLFHWMDPEYTGNIPEKILAFERKPQYTGVRRLTPKPQGTSE